MQPRNPISTVWPFPTNNRHNWFGLFTVYKRNTIWARIKTKRLGQRGARTLTHLIRACLTAPSQSTVELRWHRPAWGMGRSEVYDCADVNDITQILNQAARFQHSGSSALALRLEILTWSSAAEQTHPVQALVEQTGLAESDGSDVRPAAVSVTPFPPMVI